MLEGILIDENSYRYIGLGMSLQNNYVLDVKKLTFITPQLV